jgi:hypothetical protein
MNFRQRVRRHSGGKADKTKRLLGAKRSSGELEKNTSQLKIALLF